MSGQGGEAVPGTAPGSRAQALSALLLDYGIALNARERIVQRLAATEGADPNRQQLDAAYTMLVVRHVANPAAIIARALHEGTFETLAQECAAELATRKRLGLSTPRAESAAGSPSSDWNSAENRRARQELAEQCDRERAARLAEDTAPVKAATPARRRRVQS